MNGKPIKSVHLTNYYHEKSGGVSTNYNHLLDAAARHERFVRLIVPGETDRVEDISDFARIYFVKAPRSPIVDKRYRLILPWQYLLSGTRIREILLEEMPDMIEIYDNYSLTLLAGIVRKGRFKSLQRPMLVYFTGERLDTIISTFISKGSFGKWFAHRLLGNYNLAMFDFYIANSPFVAEELFEATQSEHNASRSEAFFNKCWSFFRASKIPLNERLRICPRGVDTARFSPARRSEKIRNEILETAGIPRDSMILMTSTHLSDEKNIRILPDVMERLAKDPKHDYRLLVAGAGPREEWIREETARRFPGKIVLLGHLGRDTLADYYANTDVFIHPNPREPFGNVVLEAMASGVPVVVPNAGGVLTYATSENAELADPTPDGFAESIRRVANDRALAEKHAKAALETTEQNTVGNATDALFATYDAMYADFIRRHDEFAYDDAPVNENFNDLFYTDRFVN